MLCAHMPDNNNDAWVGGSMDRGRGWGTGLHKPTYSGEPQTVLMSSPTLYMRLMPKSATLMRNSSTAPSHSRFSGLRSRWHTWFWCMYRTALMICRTTSATSLSVYVARHRILSYTSPPVTLLGHVCACNAKSVMSKGVLLVERGAAQTAP